MNEMQLCGVDAFARAVLCAGVLGGFGGATAGDDNTVACIEVHVTRAHVKSTNEAQILLSIAHREDGDDLLIHLSEFHGLAWWATNRPDQFAMQLNQLSDVRQPRGGANPHDELSFDTQSLLCGETREFGWEGVGNNVVQVYERGDYSAPFDARLRVCREIFAFTVDPNRALAVFAGVEAPDADDRVERQEINGKRVERFSEVTDRGRMSYVRVVDSTTGRVVRWHWIKSSFSSDRSVILLVRVVDQRNCDRPPVEIETDSDVDVAKRLHEIHFDVKGVGPISFDVQHSRKQRNPELDGYDSISW